jgi:hypothetical protein
VSNYQKIHNSLKLLGIVDGIYAFHNFGITQYNYGIMHVNNLTYEELEIIDLLKNQGVDVPLAWENVTFFED